MKKEKFVDVDLAIELQKFNYNIDDCFGYFVKQSDGTYFLNIYQEEFEGYTNKNLRIDAPLISEVIDWLFDEHNIHIEFNFNDFNWVAYIGIFTIPDFCPDNNVTILLEDETFKNAKKEKRNIMLLAIKEALKLIKK